MYGHEDKMFDYQLEAQESEELEAEQRDEEAEQDWEDDDADYRSMMYLSATYGN